MTELVVTELKEDDFLHDNKYDLFGVLSTGTEFIAVGFVMEGCSDEAFKRAQDNGLVKVYASAQLALEAVDRAQEREKLLRPQWQMLVYAEQQARRYMQQEVLRVL